MRRALLSALVVGLVAGSALAVSAGPHHSGWALAQKIDEVGGNHPDLNTSAADGCPIESPDGLSLFMASNRTGTEGGLDIWVASRAHRNDPWGAPVNLSEINSAADEFCPTPLQGNGLLFVSRRTIPGVTCGAGDIYFTRFNPAHGWGAPEHLGCDPLGPNSSLDEQGPSYVHAQLYFSRSTFPSPGTSGEIFVSDKIGDMTFGAASPIVELNDPAANDIQPNVRKDGREIVFSSTRTGGFGGPDIWAATRANVTDPWSAPFNLGSNVNTTYGESRPSFSWDALQLLFGRAGPLGTGEGGTGASDIYVTTRSKTGN